MTEEEQPIDIERFDGQWEPAPVPSGFADRVAEAWQSERAEVQAPKSRPWRVLGIVAAVVAAAVVLGLWFPWGATDTGELVADERTTVELGDRALAVAEPGTRISWAADGTSMRVEQDAGTAFYRVDFDNGSEFSVVTPHGVVEVTGTCFTVEIIPMQRKSNLVKAMAATAALTAAVVVTVYEGGVVLADDSGEVHVAAGEKATADGSRRPHRMADDDLDEEDAAELARKDPNRLVLKLRDQAREIDELQQRESAQGRRIETLQEQITALGGDATPAEKGKELRCARASRNSGCPFLEPSQEVLEEMARCAAVKVDFPGFVHRDVPIVAKNWGNKLGMSDAEAQTFVETAEGFRDGHAKSLREIYIEAGGDPDFADEQTAETLDALITSMLDPGEIEQARRQIAKERAGLVEPTPTEQWELVDRFTHEIADVGNNFEAAVADSFGADRARELRLKDDGWPGGTSVYSGNCEER